MHCRICGEEKEARDFYRLKHFYKYLNARKIWCRDCMKMYVEMKKEETRKKELEVKEWFFVLRFD